MVYTELFATSQLFPNGEYHDRGGELKAIGFEQEQKDPEDSPGPARFVSALPSFDVFSSTMVSILQGQQESPRCICLVASVWSSSVAQRAEE